MNPNNCLSRAEKQRRLNNLDTDTLMRWAYVPFIVAEGAWDYADSIIDIAIQMRLDQTKPISRKIRELRRSYIALRRGAKIGARGYEMDNFYVIENNAKSSFRYMYACIKESVQKQYPQLDGEYRQLLTAVYACLTILDVLFKYMEIQESVVCQKCGFGSISSLIPDEMRTLQKLVPLFAGDKPVKVKGRGLFVHNIVQSLCKCPLTENKAESVVPPAATAKHDPTTAKPDPTA